MRRKTILMFLPLVACLVLGALLWQGLHRDPHFLPSTLINKPVPKFEGSDALKGQVVLLNVFVTWCEPCHYEHPVLMDIKNSGAVKIYGLNFRDNTETTQSWLKKVGNPYEKVFFDNSGKISEDFGVNATPQTFLIDSKGIIRDKVVGPVTERVWNERLLPEIKEYQEGQK